MSRQSSKQTIILDFEPETIVFSKQRSATIQETQDSEEQFYEEDYPEEEEDVVDSWEVYADNEIDYNVVPDITLPEVAPVFIAPTQTVVRNEVTQETKQRQLEQWAKSLGLSADDIPGSFDEKYEEMTYQKELTLSKFIEESKREEEKKFAQSKADSEKRAVLHTIAKKKAGKDRFEEKTKTCNAKGKLQGAKTKVVQVTKGRRAMRKEAEEKEKAKATKPTEAPLVSCALVPQIEIEEHEDILGEAHPVVIEEEVVIVTKEQELCPVQEAKKEEVAWTKIGTTHNKPKVLLLEVGKSLIASKKEAMYGPVTTSAPTNSAQPYKVEKTQLCLSVGSKTRCPHGARCRFAHGVEELVKKQCRFGCECVFTKKSTCIPNTYTNTRKDKKCSFWHPDESNKSYAFRMGIAYTEPVKVEQVKSEVKVAQVKVAVVAKPSVWVKPVAPVSVAPSKLAPWATFKNTITVMARVSRWGPEVMTPEVAKAQAKAFFEAKNAKAVAKPIAKPIAKPTVKPFAKPQAKPQVQEEDGWSVVKRKH